MIDFLITAVLFSLIVAGTFFLTPSAHRTSFKEFLMNVLPGIAYGVTAIAVLFIAMHLVAEERERKYDTAGCSAKGGIAVKFDNGYRCFKKDSEL